MIEDILRNKVYLCGAINTKESCVLFYFVKISMLLTY